VNSQWIHHRVTGPLEQWMHTWSQIREWTTASVLDSFGNLIASSQTQNYEKNWSECEVRAFTVLMLATVTDVYTPELRGWAYCLGSLDAEFMSSSRWEYELLTLSLLPIPNWGPGQGSWVYRMMVFCYQYPPRAVHIFFVWFSTFSGAGFPQKKAKKRLDSTPRRPVVIIFEDFCSFPLPAISDLLIACR